MKRAFCVLLLVLEAGCKPAPPVETVEYLVANPERLNELRHQCRYAREKVTDEICARVAEATNRRFFGDGKTPYSPSDGPPKF